MCIYHTYKASAIDALLAKKSTPKHHVSMLGEKRHFNIFEEEIKMKTSEQTTPPGYALVIIDEGKVKAI